MDYKKIKNEKISIPKYIYNLNWAGALKKLKKLTILK